MADKPKMSDEERDAGMVEALNKGIKEANGQMSDKEFVLIKRAKKALRQAKRAAKDLLPEVAKKAQGQISDREAQLLRDEQ